MKGWKAGRERESRKEAIRCISSTFNNFHTIAPSKTSKKNQLFLYAIFPFPFPLSFSEIDKLNRGTIGNTVLRRYG